MSDDRRALVTALSAVLADVLDEAAMRAAAQPRHLTVPELAKRWRVSTTLAWRLVNSGKLPVVEIEGAVRVDVRDADAYADKVKRRRKPASAV